MGKCIQINGEIVLTASSKKGLTTKLKNLFSTDVTQLSSEDLIRRQTIESKFPNVTTSYTQPSLDKMVKNMLNQDISQFDNIQADFANSDTFRITSSIEGQKL